LLVCNLVMWTVGNGLVPLLPVYATRLGADPAAAGYYLAFSYLALAVGAVAAGWVSDRLQQRKMPLIVAGAAGVPLAWLAGRVGNISALTVLTALLWFCGGLGRAAHFCRWGWPDCGGNGVAGAGPGAGEGRRLSHRPDPICANCYGTPPCGLLEGWIVFRLREKTLRVFPNP